MDGEQRRHGRLEGRRGAKVPPEVALDSTTSAREDRVMSPWAAIVGRTEHGKRDALQYLLSALRGRGRSVAGLLQEETAEGGLELVDLATHERAALARHDERSPDICSFAFDAAIIELGRRWVARSKGEIVLLELGKLEARGQGHWPAARDVLAGDHRLALFAVRPDVLFDVAYQLEDPVAGLELPAERGQLDAFIEELLAQLPAK